MSRSLRCVIFLAEVQSPISVHLEKKQRTYAASTSTCYMQIYAVCMQQRTDRYMRHNDLNLEFYD